MGDVFGMDAGLIAVINMLISMALLVVVIILNIKLGKMKKRHRQLLNGETNVNVEQLLIQIQDKLNRQEAGLSEAHGHIKQVQDKMKKMKTKAGIHRYNAFGDRGSDLSFSVAIIDEYQDGVVMTGIHSREQTYMYAKPVQKGESPYTLSPEEKEAISLSAKQS